MPILRAQVEIDRISQLPEDKTVNVWHFVRNGTAEGTFLDAADTALDNFYTAIRPNLSNQLVLTSIHVKWYDLADAEPRVPIRESTIGPPSNSTDDPLPSEVAVVLSFQAAGASGAPQARRRGRLFLGPIGRGTQDAADRDRLSTTHAATFRDAAQVMLTTDNPGGSDEGWAVYSRVDAAARLVINGYIDNAYDTQRRRGRAPTVRHSFPI